MNPFNSYLIEGAADAVTAGFKTLTESNLDAGEVLVKLRYASVNYKDALAATGKVALSGAFPASAASTRRGSSRLPQAPASSRASAEM
jgi:acrylyl-CoA reductase (NADPH)